MFGGIVNAIKGFFDLVTTLVEFVFGFLQDMVNFAQQLVQVPFTVAAAFDTLLPAQISCGTVKFSISYVFQFKLSEKI